MNWRNNPDTRISFVKKTEQGVVLSRILVIRLRHDIDAKVYENDIRYQIGIIERHTITGAGRGRRELT
jgi:hypothetical protein